MNREVQPSPLFASSNNQGKVSATKSITPKPTQNRHRKKNKRPRRGLLGLLFPNKSVAKKSNRRRRPGTPTVARNLNSAPELHPPRTKNAPLAKEEKSFNILPTPLAIATRLLVLTVGVSTILGSAVAISDSLKTVAPTEDAIATETIAATDSSTITNIFSGISLDKEITKLKDKLSSLTANYTQLEAGVYIVDLDNKNYVNFNGSQAYSAASTIKIPVLVAFFEDVDAGKIRLDEKLVVTKEVIGGGSGYMQYKEIGTKYSALHTATDMIRVSDNTATNMLIQRLGGMEVLNQRFAEWGLNNTAIRNPLPDLTGTNTTSPVDLGNLLIKINRGDLISLRSRDRLLAIMRTTKTRTLLPQGIEKDAVIAHKTGDIRSSLGDAGIVDMPNGKRYIVSVLVKRPANDPQAKILIQKISQTTYQHLKFYNDRPFISEQ
ncbi:beta-lactamase class A [Xenococcus sp. PCC 7305]|uniref:serine hydrolase n=1 Tax=Xenococcus sp. PCC 7305 TaxID=102125 RepID=UPI0002AC7298|nr:serine hydrolase [Xenococcus sp. PCC 7305]ELS03336.1 beta-lactamase class A [Xenococcus sp. PCC 7305]